MASHATFSRREVNRALLVAAFGVLSGGQGLARGAGLISVPLFDFAIAGGFYHGLQTAQASLRPGMVLDLRREPDNPHDGDAVAVHRADGLRLGYVPRRANTPVARLMDAGRVVRADILRMLTAEKGEDIPDSLAFTSFTSGDPMIRLSVQNAAA